MQWNSETDAIARWFDGESVKPALIRLVVAWNGLELLDIDLADQLREMVHSSSGSLSEHERVELDKVDWGHLAEHYAYEICGVTEEELTRRRVAQGGQP